MFTMLPLHDNRYDMFTGIMAAHIFPSLADVLTDCMGADDNFDAGYLTAPLYGMEANNCIYSRCLEESDFLNDNALDDANEPSTELVEAVDLQDLSGPAHLMVPMWSQASESDDVAMVELEITIGDDSSPANSNDLDLDAFTSSPHSLDSTDDFTDYSSGSDSGSDLGSDVGSPDSMIMSYPRVKVEPMDDSMPCDYTSATLSSQMLPVKEERDSGIDGSDSNEDLMTITENRKKKPGRKKGQVSKVYHLWEFMRDLILNEKHCPKIIKWIDRSEGIFRVVKSNEIAKLWGAEKKHKKKMTYEKLSRSLRYSRKEGYFGDVPKDGRFPKKLCFKFGPKSTGWRDKV